MNHNPHVSALFIFVICIVLLKKHKDKCILLLCFAALLMTIVFFTGVLNPANYKRITLWFAIPFATFIVSFVSITFLNFRKQTSEK